MIVPGASGRPSIPKIGTDASFWITGNLHLRAKLMSRKLPSAPLSMRAEAGSQERGDDISQIFNVNLLLS